MDKRVTGSNESDTIPVLLAWESELFYQLVAHVTHHKLKLAFYAPQLDCHTEGYTP